jgi:hypothetical protein
MKKDQLMKTPIPGLVKNKRTGAFLNTNIGEYHQVVAGRKQNKELHSMKVDIEILKKQVAELMIKIHG